MFNFDWICRLEYFLHPGESYGSPAADPVSTYNEVSQVSHQTIAWPSTKTYIWSQKLITHSSGTWKLWGTLCGPGHRIQRQRLQQQQQQRPSSRSSWQLWHSPRGPFHRGGSSCSPNRSNAMIIMFTLFSNIQKSGSFVIANKKEIQQNFDERLLQVMESLLKIQWRLMRSLPSLQVTAMGWLLSSSSSSSSSST